MRATFGARFQPPNSSTDRRLTQLLKNEASDDWQQAWQLARERKQHSNTSSCCCCSTLYPLPCHFAFVGIQSVENEISTCASDAGLVRGRIIHANEQIFPTSGFVHVKRWLARSSCSKSRRFNSRLFHSTGWRLPHRLDDYEWVIFCFLVEFFVAFVRFSLASNLLPNFVADFSSWWVSKLYSSWPDL